MQHRQIEAFRALMTTGSASRAAELLGVTQPAVSRCIAELEREVGFALFDRIRSRLVPTAEGRMFFTEVNAHFLAMARLKAAALRIKDFGPGDIKIASLPALGARLIPKAIATFQRAHPGIGITLQVRSSSTVRDLVASGLYDIGVVSDEIDCSGLDSQHFADYRVVAVLPPDHPLSKKATITACDLLDTPFLGMDLDDRLARELTQAFNNVGGMPKIAIEAQYSTTICALALEGAGIGLVNPVAAYGYDQLGLHVKPFEPALHFRKRLIFPPGRPRSQILRNFLRILYRVRNHFNVAACTL